MSVRIINSDALSALRTLPERSVQAAICSPPYLALRSYLPDGHPDKAKEIGAEPTPDAFVAALVEVFAEVARVLRPDGLLFVNLGDSMSGSGKGPTGRTGLGDQRRRQGFIPGEGGNQGGARNRDGVGRIQGIPAKNCLLVPERFALAMQAAGWIVRSRMPWIKANCMPESVRDRPVSAIEWVFMFAKQGAYYWDAESVRRENSTSRPDRIGLVKRSSEKQIRSRALGANGFNPESESPYGVGGRSFRNSDLFWSHVEAIKAGNGLLLDEGGDPLALLVNPKPSGLEHFAAYPDTLVEPLIRAATSEKGQCPACGAPWRRVVARDGASKWAADDDIRDFNNDGRTANPQSSKSLHRQKGGVYSTAKVLGWEPSCRCDAGDPVPQVVLDCFGGSGTTGVVADRLGRDAILVELNPKYAEMARRRIEGDAPLFASVEVAS